MRVRGICKRAAAVVLAAVCMLTAAPLQVQAEVYWPEGPGVSCPSAIVMEVNTGTVLYAKKSHKKRYPASITKILTALLAVESCGMDETVVFSADAVYKNEGDTSNIARDLNEEMTMEQCLYAVMLESANECAYAVAEHIGQKQGGDYSTFIEMMNARASALGCKDTHFNNCNGLPDEEHWTSAYDMALIAAEAYRNETFRIITGSESYTIPPTNKHKDPTPCHNHHKMVYPWRGDSHYLWENVTGGKTGYTTAAKNTLVTYAEKDGLSLVCVVMNADTPNHYTDTRTLLDYCFDNFQALNISENETSLANGSLGNTGVLNDYGPFVALDENAYIVIPKAAEFADAVVELDQDTADGGTLARLQYTYGKRVVGHAEIAATGARVEESYFEKQKPEIPVDENVRVIEIKPEMLALAALILAAFIVLIHLGKSFYDNYYVIRHKRKVKKAQKERFKVKVHKKRYRKKDRMFKS
ncbi:MAG: D-alanyl-D-alanine carboxypeptidase [Muribaculaceae bacterium]|nr:D-alanyl-D-alanine carboxypeptidase [Roseburia sp.]MCM1432009.1 D-alanyl-D-alanine carboxypeptidase [Muribaculaceae bacterium]MCM1493737.1 D-alanyl-D-alanine carboxypeptidase [Muribaculaceae bacterium]